MADRAAKKRGKVWRGVLIVVASFALVVGGMVWVVWPYVMAEPAAPDPAALERLNALLMEGQPEGVNGWEVLRPLLIEHLGQDAFGGDRSEVWAAITAPETDVTELFNNEWDDPRLAGHRAALSAAAAALLPTLDAAVAHERFFVPYRWDGRVLADDPDMASGVIELPMALMGVTRTLSVVNAMSMRAAAEAGDWDEVERRFESGLVFSERMGRQLLLIEVLVGAASEGVLLLEARKLLNEFDIPPQTVGAMLAALESRGDPFANGERLVRGERIWSWVYARSAFSKDGVVMLWNTDPFLSGPPGVLDRVMNIRAMTLPTLGKIEPLWDEMEANALLAFNNKPYTPVDVDRWRLPIEMEDLVTLEAGSFREVGTQLRRVRAEAAGLGVMLRLEIYHAEHGRWPAALTEAMTEVEATDPVSGRPFEYAVVDEPGRPYSLRFPENAAHLLPILEDLPFDPHDLNAPRRTVPLMTEDPDLIDPAP